MTHQKLLSSLPNVCTPNPPSFSSFLSRGLIRATQKLLSIELESSCPRLVCSFLHKTFFASNFLRHKTFTHTHTHRHVRQHILPPPPSLTEHSAHSTHASRKNYFKTLARCYLETCKNSGTDLNSYRNVLRTLCWKQSGHSCSPHDYAVCISIVSFFFPASFWTIVCVCKRYHRVNTGHTRGLNYAHLIISSANLAHLTQWHCISMSDLEVAGILNN